MNKIINKTISYVIPAYFGPRDVSHYKQLKNNFFYLEKQFEFINRQIQKPDIIYIICTFSEFEKKENILDEIKNKFGKDNIIIKDRENTAGSYGSWHYALELDNGFSDFIFLTEDDHILFEENSLIAPLIFWDKYPDLFYLCQYWNEKPYHFSINGKNHIIKAHAAMSGGIINNKLYKTLKEEKKLDFSIFFIPGKEFMYYNQAYFLEEYRLNNILIMDWTEKYSSYFPHSNIDYGNPQGLKILMPIIENIIE